MQPTCPICASNGPFDGLEGQALADAIADSEHRERLVCATCGSISRDRALVLGLASVLGHALPMDSWPANKRLRVFETSGYRAHPVRLAERYDYFNTRYLPPAELPAQMDGREAADLQDLPYPDGFFDLVVSAEVLEHVNDHRLALREIHRVLADDGAFVLQTPYDHTNPRTDYWVHRWHDTDVLMRPPEYHAEDTLVYQIFGRDLMTHMRDAGFSVAYLFMSRPHFAITPQHLFLASRKPYVDVTHVV